MHTVLYLLMVSQKRPASQGFHVEKINWTFLATSSWLRDFIREKHFLQLCKLEETGGNSTPGPLIDSIETKDVHLAGLSQLSRALSCLTSSITLSYPRTFAFPSAKIINIQLSPANLSGSLITHYKSAYASIYIGIRKEHPVLGTLKSQMQSRGFPFLWQW